MHSSKRVVAMVTLAIAFLLISSPFIGFSSFTAPTVNASGASASVSQAGDYGDIMQYEWPYAAYNESRVLSYDGPAPDKPDLLWTFSPTPPPGAPWWWIFANGPASAVTCFSGKAFVCSYSQVYALDPFTGGIIWQSALAGVQGFVPVGAWKLDDTYLCVDTGSSSPTGAGGTQGGLACYRIDNGTKVWEVDMGILGHAGAELKNYWPMTQSTELKMKYVLNYNTTTLLNKVIAWNLSATPAPPHIEWEYIVDEPCEILCFGDGKLFVGTYTYHIFALDGKTGNLVWKARKIGIAGYSAIYANGRLYHGDSSTRLTCYNASTGTILWDAVQAGREFFSYGEAYAYGRIYAKNIGVPEGFIGCWDAETGELLWKTAPANYWIGYLWGCVGDGKMFIIRSDGMEVAESEPLPAHFVCLDAFSGEVLWTLPYQFSSPTLGYGMLFGVSFGTLYCFGQKPWSYFRGNIDNPGIGQSGPTDLSSPRWTYETMDAVQSSPAVVDGKVYIGSNDQNLYCLDAYTGSRFWNFSTEYKLRSSPAVVDGKVYLGPDDGYIYCLDAEDGSELWKKDLYAGNVPPILIEVSTFQPRSSPIVVGGGLYVGALDGNVYCLNKENGTILWTYPTEGPICGSPAYADGTIYIASTDRNMYALDASNGNKIWNWMTPKETTQLHFAPTPTVAEGKVFFGGGAAYDTPIIFVALHANNGTIAWQINMNRDSNTQPIQAPTYADGVIYTSEYMGASAFNAADGSRIWNQWLGHQVFSSVAYADDLRGNATGYPGCPKIYVGCDSYSVTCLNATSGAPLSSYTTGAPVSSSPALWEGKLYVGSSDGYVYCFDDAPLVSTEIWAESSKGAEMWTNETVVIGGKLDPEIPDATILVTFTKPDQTQVDVTTTTNLRGYFSASCTPTVAGNWSWTAWYEGQELRRISYSYAYTDDMPLKVVSPGEEPTNGNGEELPSEGIPLEYIYAIVGVIAIIIIAVVAYAYMKRGKK